MGRLPSLNDVLGLLSRQPTLSLKILTNLSTTERIVARQNRHAILENTDVGGLMADVDESHDPSKSLRIIMFEGVVKGESIDVDHDRFDARVLQQTNLVVH